MRSMWWHGAASKLEAGAPFVMLALWLYLGGQFVNVVVMTPSAWNWFSLGLWVFVVIGTSWQCVNVIRRRVGTPALPVVAPDTVSTADVEAAIASTPNRVSAIRAVRERHPGLGLKAAVDLVDAALDARNE
ncbi:hypothetical protein ERC79_20780 [Rhodococcus sp. ABRD24]|uniref:hypothetical protein n=1 Tax=Rhodococcus sp. ABRD24 TaxID=2507582 RepID=UPI00103DA627|nr:hypothetical protein [Rhodococcus sp. ABRD24]QBJ98105.1 hypothetical protein ERC79_20780 [Rhodococcus sp. ABRD24]